MASGTEDTSNTDITSITEKMKYNFIDAIDVAVGDTKTLFRIPKNLICKHSTFFAAACSERWAKDESTPIDLSDDKAEVFEIYLQWLYTGDLVIDDVHGSTEATAAKTAAGKTATGKTTAATNTSETTTAANTTCANTTSSKTTSAKNNDDECQENRWMKLVELHVLADKLGDNKATEILMKQIRTKVVDASNGDQAPPSAAVFRFIWKHTVDSNGLRAIFLPYIVGRMEYKQILELGDHLEDFFSDCTKAFLAAFRGDDAERQGNFILFMGGWKVL